MIKSTARAILLVSALPFLVPAIAVPVQAQAPASVIINPPVRDGWGRSYTDVPPDRAIRLGKLPNGMRYAILRNQTPKGTASVRLRFEFGSIHEAENERGLAHFIEHMAFNGTTNVTEGEMIKRLERLGLAFGPDTNASTGFDSTTYMLDLPEVGPARVDTALFLMREVASEVRFDPAAVERERGVILGERRSRDGYRLRQQMDQLNHLLPEAAYPNRLPIGTLPVLTKASAEAMRDLYRRYYRPERATLVVVGDIDPDAIEAKLKAKFADWRGSGAAGAEPNLGKVDFDRPSAIDTYRNQNIPTSVSLSVLRPFEDPADTLAERRKNLVRSLGSAIFSRRLTRLVNRDGSPLLSASAGGGAFDQLALTSGIGVTAKDGAWADALTAAENELRSALTHGFTAAELKREMARTETAFRTAAEQANTRRNGALAGAILATVEENDFVTHPAWRLTFFNQVKPGLTLDAVNAEFRAQWQGSAPLIHVSEKLAVRPADIGLALDKAKAMAVGAPTDEADKAFAYDSFGEPGRVAEDKRIDDFGIRTVRFANNVRLNIKRTDFEAGRVRFSVRMAGGQLALPADKPGLRMMLSSLSSIGGTGKHSFEEIKEALAGKVYSAGTAVGADAFVAGGSTTPADLALQMKVSAAYLTDPGFRPEAAQRWANMVPVMDKQFDSEPEAVYASRAQAALMGGDMRFGAPPAATLLQRNFAEARSSIAPLAASAPIEIGIVGDVDEDAAIKAVAASFGALPTRAADVPDYREARRAALRSDRSPLEMSHQGNPDKALVAALWPTDDDDDYRRVIGMSMLAKALDLILTERIREELGASYGVNVGSSMSNIYDGFGTLAVSTVVAPAKIAEVERTIDAAVAEVREKPVNDDLFQRVRAPMLEALIKSRRENGFWMSVVDEAQGKADRLDRFRQQEAIFKSITPAELHQLARTYLTSETIRRVRIKRAPIVRLKPLAANKR